MKKFNTVTAFSLLMFLLFSGTLLSQQLMQPYIMKKDGEVIKCDFVNAGTFKVQYKKKGKKYKVKKKEVKFALEGEKKVFSRDRHFKEVFLGKIKIGVSANAEGYLKEKGSVEYTVGVRNGDKMIVRRDIDNPNGNVVYQYFFIDGKKVYRFHQSKLNDKDFLKELLGYFNICSEIEELFEEYINNTEKMNFGDLNTFNSTLEYIYLENCLSIPESK